MIVLLLDLSVVLLIREVLILQVIKVISCAKVPLFRLHLSDIEYIRLLNYEVGEIATPISLNYDVGTS